MISQSDIEAEVARALEEDVGLGDLTASLLPSETQVSATIICREPMLVCGQAWVEAAFHRLDPAIHLEWWVQEGQWLPESTTLCVIHGAARPILTAERTALNFLQCLSGTATETYHFLQVLRGTGVRLLDTRKTIPGLRQAQKYAVRCAGGENHRMGLYDAFLIKENHIAACGSIGLAVERAKACAQGRWVEVEVETLEELREALAARPDRILLDNFTHAMMREAVAINQPKVCPLEVSGGVDRLTIKHIAETGVDYISVGGLTKSVRAIDLSLRVE